MNRYFADFHIHIGESHGKPVKITASKNMTLERVLAHSAEEKGLHAVTVIDGVCPPVMSDLRDLVNAGELTVVKGGGYIYRDKLLVLPGAEVEVGGPMVGAAHFGCWFPSLQAAGDFSDWLGTVQTNTSLSSQRARTTAENLQRQVHSRQGLFIVHHAFTPHKGAYGNCVNYLAEMMDLAQVDAVELGLSADADMADCIEELQQLPYVTNSDAHSLGKIAREYNELLLETLSLCEVRQALRRWNGRRIAANYGLEPRLGKYHRTTCSRCGQRQEGGVRCHACGRASFTAGVYDRWLQLRDWPVPHHPHHRPPYHKQIPLEFIPGLGPKTWSKLMESFGSEMAVLHQSSVDDLSQVCGKNLAMRIHDARRGRLQIQVGGGGQYGKIRIN